MKNLFVLLLSSCLFALSPAQAQLKGGKQAHFPAGQEGNGLRADYFNGSNFQEKVLTRIDEEVNFYYYKESPAPGVNIENYSIRWTGSLYAPATGTYKVFVRVDDGVRLWLNGVKLLDEWRLQEATTFAGKLNLKAGEFYSLKIEYFNEPLDAVMQLTWESPEDKTTHFFGLFEDTPRKVIPKKYLFGKLPERELTPAPSEIKKEVVANTTTAEAPKKKAKEAAPEIAKRKSPDKTTQPIKTSPDINSFNKLEAGEVVQFKTLWFEQGKFVLMKASYPELDRLTKALQKHSTIKIRIEGHTDNIGDPELNQSLSLFRAKVVATYLIDKGIEPNRIKAKGYGHSKPVADNSTEEGRAKNRRVEFVVE